MTSQPARPFKILSLDGGGFKGLYTACVLAEIEKFNKPIAQHFDLICGTSVGGLIALALAKGRTAEEIKNLFLEQGEIIFPRGSWFVQKYRSAAQYVGGGKYSDIGLRSALKCILGDTVMREANSYLCIPTLNLPTMSPILFKTDHDNTLTRDSDVPMADVARATSAAPTYFPIAEIEVFPGHQYADGGLWANNPSLVALVEAFRFFVGPGKRYDSVQLLSIGTIDDSTPRPITRSRHLSVFSGGKEIFDATLAAQERTVALQLDFLKDMFCSPVEYIRIPSPKPSPDQISNIGLDVVTEASKKILQMFGKVVGQEWNRKPEITAFFTVPTPLPVFRTTNNLHSQV